MKRRYPKVYGKQQGAHPGRWLTKSEAFDRLVGACQDGTIIGLRDELVIRLGLCGIRRAEIVALTFRDLASLPTITFMGKGHKARKIVAGPSLVDALTRWTAAYTDPTPDSPVICPTDDRTHKFITWGKGYSPITNSIADLIARRATLAGLGHVAPHDLRRTAAGILHTTKTADGGHLFDLLDIQKVLDHSDPATTMRSYLDPMDTGVKDRAGATLD